jgi:CO/xanthine dehydrogenase FAD-binding subunit
VAVGAMARQRDLEISPDALKLNPLIEATLHNVAHAVVRNRGTAVGSIAHADASAELPTLFTVLDGVAKVASTRGTRHVTGGELFSFHLTNTLEADELVSEVWLPPLDADEGYAYVEYARRHGDYALAGVCATVRLDGDRIASARLGFSGVATKPVRCAEAEAALAGQTAGDEAFAAAGDVSAEHVVEVGDDFVATRSYRQHLVRRLTQQALREAVECAHARRGS